MTGNVCPAGSDPPIAGDIGHRQGTDVGPVGRPVPGKQCRAGLRSALPSLRGVGHPKSMSSFTLVHSPLVGPLSWLAVQVELRKRGHEVQIPSLVSAATSGSWQACVDAAVGGAATGDDLVLVGHSRAGPLLPVIACRMDPPPGRLVFVDARLPPEEGESSVSAPWLKHLQTIETEGHLPPWSEWFGPGVMEELIPDDYLRSVVVAEMPKLPLSYFEGAIPVPSGWARTRCRYVLLSEAYREEAAEATSRGWQVCEHLGSHLDILTRPVEIADSLER